MTHPVSKLVRALTECVVLLCLAAASGPALASEPLDLSAYRGKVVLLDFWASWCEPCRRSFPWLNEMSAKYGDRGLVVIGINVDRTQADAARFLRDVPASFPIIYDPSGKLATQYDVPGMPSSFVVGPDGAIAARHIGFRDNSRADREAQLLQLLSGPGVVPVR